MISNPDRLFRAPEQIIGRERELEAIATALDAPLYTGQVLYFEGPGGIGKTRLLSETHIQALGLDHTLTTDVIDLYMTRYHQPIRMMGSIVRHLRRRLPTEIQETIFPNYRHAEEQFLLMRSESVDLDHEQRQHVDQVFLSDYARLAQDYRIVLLIDTIEKLHPEIIETEPFNFRQTSRLEHWLVDLIMRLPNTLVLLAGRSRPRQRALLESSLGTRLSLFSVEPFTAEQTAAYIVSSASVPLDSDSVAMLHQASGGRPVVLTIALACAQIRAFDLMALPAGFDEQYPANRPQLSDTFVNLIVHDIQANRPDIADLLTRAIYLRKGLSVPLLEQMARDAGEQPDTASITAQLRAFARLPFVKTTGDLVVILHDELYELLFGKLGERDAPGWYRSAISYLDARLQEIRSASQQIHGDVESIQKTQSLQVEKMFYQMALDVRYGYQSYRELSNSAINDHDEDFDTQLQDELARFFDSETAWGRFYRTRLELSGLSWNQLIYDEGIRWVYRRIASNLYTARRYHDAIQIAQRVREHFIDIYSQNVLARCDLEAAQLQAEVYVPETTPRGAEIGKHYEQIVGDMEALLSGRLPVTTGRGLTSDELLYAKFVLANAYNYWGYYDRTQERLHSAIEKYKRAIRLYKELGHEVDSLRATTLNNLGFALARQGDSQRGLQFVQEALRIAVAQQVDYRVATTLNTLAHIQMDINEIGAALENVTRASEMFEQMGSVRGRALCSIAEGRVRGRLAGLWQSSQEQDEEYERSTTCYQRAIGLFDRHVTGELSRRIEARVFLSKSYRDWAAVRRSRGDDGSEQQREALSALLVAQQLCTPKTPKIILVSILESIAVLYVDQGQYSDARMMLDQARMLIPSDYDIRVGQGVIHTPATQEMRLYWLRLAQIELQYAMSDFGEQQYPAACVHLLRSFDYLLTFSLVASPVVRFRALAKQALSQIADESLLVALRDTTCVVAGDLHIQHEAVTLMDDLFAEVIEDMGLF